MTFAASVEACGWRRTCFLQTDPITGGSANNYDYVNQDPINGDDLGGTTCWTPSCIVSHGAKYARFAVEAPISVTAAGWATVVGGADCLHWNSTRAMIVCAGSSTLGGALKDGTTYGSTYDTVETGNPDFRRMRHESKHANQWLIPGFPLLYALFPRTFETQAGLRDGCYAPDSGGYRPGCA